MDADKHPVKVVQFGEGNFLRAFVDWMFDITNEQGLTNIGIAIVQPIPSGLCAHLEAQGNTYHLLLRGMVNGKTTETMRKITSVAKSMNPYADPGAFLALAANPELELILSNTTEAGIAYDKSVTLQNVPAASYPGKLTQFLWSRYKSFSGDPDKGVVVLPCELIDRNGDVLKAIVLRHAREWQLGDSFIGWLEKHCAFLNSLVDRIVPGFPRSDLEAIAGKFGVRDPMLVAAEPFHFWVIEGPAALSERWPFAKAGLDVVWTDDMTPYRDRKVRILNGCHTMTVPAAFLAGLDTVGECMNTPVTRNFMEHGLFDEIIPTLDLPATELSSYSTSVMERFSNPFIRHELLSITLNSFSKWKTRIMPSLVISLERTGKLPDCLTFSLAALIAFYRVHLQPDGTYAGFRNGVAYPVKDDTEVLKTMESLWSSFDEAEEAAHTSSFGVAESLVGLVSAVLARVDWWGRDLNCLEGYTEKVGKDLQAILEKGLPAAFPAGGE